jgi:hypothetical protein
MHRPEHTVKIDKQEVSIRRVHTEPAIKRRARGAAGEIAWLALWPDRTVSYHANAEALVRAARRLDQRDAARAERVGRAALLVTIITGNDIPPGFVPPKESRSWKRR